MVKVAVVGCCHGELDKIYSSVSNSSVDLLLICGDFQAIRNRADLDTISVPNKYKRLGDFNKYYSGIKVAPVLTIFIGGNHECSSYLKELKYGGFVAPNIYYLGEFGAVMYKGLRITGVSGIWNEYSFMQRNSDYLDTNLPYNNSTIRSIYHIKAKTFLKSYLMRDAKHHIDIALSHDWPKDIVHHGNLAQLLRFKPFFKDDINSGKLGNPLAKILVHRLRARYWFSGHLHVRFQARVPHTNLKRSASSSGENPANKRPTINSEEIELDMDALVELKTNANEIELDMDSPANETKNANEINLDMNDDDQSNESVKKSHTLAFTPAVTEFLALDKCVAKRKFIEFLHIDPIREDHSNNLYYDKRSIAVNKVIEDFAQERKNSPWTNITKGQLLNIDNELREIVLELEEQVDYEYQKLDALPNEKFVIEQERFKIIAPVEGESKTPLKIWDNNQTEYYVKEFL
ncbi:lariat debranching enzyme [[Candida] railenensis]|uniref:Lariat debranching enzyme n=1 Tax=[Candida] railenensis TaxID=45579 RepID=A0A9P0QTF9_9ASCO|nr:lariat debranching enzyme [[Candida] railenensis]